MRNVSIDQRGVALPMAMLALLILSSVMIGFSVLGATEPTIANNQLMATQARALAEAGVERAIWALNNPTEPKGVPSGGPIPRLYDGSRDRHDQRLEYVSRLEATMQIRAALPETQVLILSMHATEDFVRRALKAGASGYIVKDSAPLELKMAIEAIMRGEHYITTLGQQCRLV